MLKLNHPNQQIIRTQQINNQQSLVQPEMSQLESPSCYGVHSVQWQIFPMDWSFLDILGLIMKLWFEGFRSHHLIPWSLENLMVYKILGKRLVVHGENASTIVHPIYGKLHCWLIIFFLNHVSIFWVCLRFKKCSS
jgi:hypothetical protein